MSHIIKSDDIASQMGQLLLQGYKMLATNCNECYNVLLQDKKGVVICLYCRSKAAAEVQQEVPTKMESVNNFSDEKAGPNEDKNEREILERSVKTLYGEIEKTCFDLNKSLLVMEEKEKCLKYVRECAETIKMLNSLK